MPKLKAPSRAKSSKKKKSLSALTPTAAQLFVVKPTKSQLQKIRIVEVAIESFAVEGIEKSTYSNLAKKCDISRTLIHHYFPTMDSLFLLTAQYVRQTLLQMAKEGMDSASSDPKSQLRGYIDGCFRWIEMFPMQTRFWMLFYYQVSLGGQARAENTQLVANGHNRIKGLLISGKEKGYWHFRDTESTAKAVQLLLTGAIVSCITEDGYLSLSKAPDVVYSAVKSLLIGNVGNGVGNDHD